MIHLYETQVLISHRIVKAHFVAPAFRNGSEFVFEKFLVVSILVDFLFLQLLHGIRETTTAAIAAHRLIDIASLASVLISIILNLFCDLGWVDQLCLCI